MERHKNKSVVYKSHLIQRYIVGNHASEAVNNGREGDGPWGVAVAPNLPTSASEIKDGAPLLSVDGDSQFDGGAVVQEVFSSEDAGGALLVVPGHLLQHVSHGQLCIVLDVRHVGLHHIQTVAVDQLEHQLNSLNKYLYIRIGAKKMI